MKVIILAAGMGSRLGPLTNDKPKCMIKLLGQTLIERQIKIFHSYGINDITIVTGYKSKVVDIPDVNYVNNVNYETTNMNESLFVHFWKRRCVKNVPVGVENVTEQVYLLQSLFW